LVADDKHDVTRAIVVITLGFPVDRGELGFVGPGLRTSDGNALLFKDSGKLVQILFRFIDDPLGERPPRYFG
jgi:hypothetical protein